MPNQEQAHYAERAIVALAGVQSEMLNGLRALAEVAPEEAARIGSRMARSAELAGGMLQLWLTSCTPEPMSEPPAWSPTAAAQLAM